jgi:hypothetical protein
MGTVPPQVEPNRRQTRAESYAGAPWTCPRFGSAKQRRWRSEGLYPFSQ